MHENFIFILTKFTKKQVYIIILLISSLPREARKIPLVYCYISILGFLIWCQSYVINTGLFT